MNENRFWIGGYTNENEENVPWLVSTSDGKPYLCCRCPCVKYYAILAFRVIQLMGENHSDYNWCYQRVYANPVGIDQNDQVHLDDIVYLESPEQSTPITINGNAGLYEECGRTVISVIGTEEHISYYEVRAYFLTAKYDCYDDFRAECYGHCTDLPCAEYDPQTQECTRYYSPKVFNGLKRPCYGNTSIYLAMYGCTSYWQDLASSRYVPAVNMHWGVRELHCSFEKDQYNCLETQHIMGCVDWDEQGECIEYEDWEICVREGLYAARASINYVDSYHVLIWDDSQEMPERTTAANIGWLSSAISSIIPMIVTARGTSPSTWRELTGYTYNSDICSHWSVHSEQYCDYSNGEAVGKVWNWQCGTLTLTKPASAHAQATGAKIRITTTVRSYDGTYGPDHEPSYVENVYVETRDVQWGVEELLRTADNLSVTASAQACYSGDYSPACVTPCEPYPSEQCMYSIEVIDYLFGESSSSAGSN